MARTPHGAPALTLRIANQVATAQGYDGVLRPTVRVHYFTPGTANVFWNYAFNAASQLSSIARDNDAFAWTNHYAIERPYTTNGLNQYSAAGDATFLYDLNGNLIADPKRAFVYDIENRLVSATPLPGSDAVAAALVYDPLGRLFQVSSPITGTRRFLYDGDALVAEYNGANQIARRHVHWPGADLPMVTYQGEGLATIRQLLADHQGSIVALADATGAAVQINRYDEYGIPGAGNDGTFQYTGQMWLPELGMYHYKARIYSPTLGRFLQTDPIGYDDQFNLYAYVGNDPVNATDPDGRQVEARVIWNALPAPWRATILERVADAVEIGGVAWDIATLPTIVGSGPEGIATTQALSASIRAAARQEARSAARGAGRNAPNPHGSRGAPDHQADVHGPGQGQAERQARPGEEVRTERAVVGHPGVNRRPDNQIVGRDGRTRLVVESERRPNSARHRERVEQYRRCGIECQTRPLPSRPRNGQ